MNIHIYTDLKCKSVFDS